MRGFGALSPYLLNPYCSSRCTCSFTALEKLIAYGQQTCISGQVSVTPTPETANADKPDSVAKGLPLWFSFAKRRLADNNLIAILPLGSVLSIATLNLDNSGGEVCRPVNTANGGRRNWVARSVYCGTRFANIALPKNPVLLFCLSATTAY